jgi:hypothetical protein
MQGREAGAPERSELSDPVEDDSGEGWRVTKAELYLAE